MINNNMNILLRIITFPFTSINFYKKNNEKDYLEILLEKDSYKEFQDECGKENGFIEAVLKEFLNKQLILDFDNINLLINKYYGYDQIKGKNIIDIYLNILSQLAQSFVCHRNGRIALKYWENKNDRNFIGPYDGLDKIQLWNLLNRIMDTNIIVFKYLIDNNMADREYLYAYYSSIAIEDIQLENILEKGVAETHLHKGAAINFAMTWIQLMNNASADIYKEKNLEDRLYDDFGISNYLKAIMIVRINMGIYISKYSNSKDNFSEYIFSSGEYDNQKERKQKEIIEDIFTKVFNGEPIKKEFIDRCRIKDLIKGLKQRYKLVTSNTPSSLDLYADDIMNLIFDDYEEIRTTSENIFLFESLKYIKEKKDNYFAGILFQYLRIKNYIFQRKVQNDSIKGLDNFKRIYSRSTSYHYNNTISSWKILIENQLQNNNLRKLELRTKFSDKGTMCKNIKLFLQAYKEILNSYYKDAKNEEIPKVGLVFHFIKKKDEKGSDKCWQNVCGNDVGELYYLRQRKNYSHQMNDLNEIRTTIPGIDNYILGIDAASVENDTDPWVFAPVYEKARDSKTQKLIYKGKKRVKTRNLGFTFHVGEDFRHIVSGLRKIDEVIEHFKFHAGDRIGHGIALGIDIDYWISNNSVVTLPRGEYLDNLLWIWGSHKYNGYLKELDTSFLEREIMSITEEIFGNIEGINIYSLWKAYQYKFRDFEVNEKYIGNISCENSVFCKYFNTSDKDDVRGNLWTFEALKYIQHCRCYLVKIMEPIQIKVDKHYVSLYRNLQLMLIKKISSLGIVVETNPTSNLSIGCIEDLFHHYIFNLNNKEHNEEGNSVLVTINSDDPSVFNTNVSSEMAYMFYALQEHNYTREEALMWIDKIRNYGMETSFIKERNLSCDEIIKELDDIIEQLH